MAENVGSIYWQVDADTSPAINSTKQFDAQVNQVEKSLQGLDTRTTKTAKAVNSGMAGIGRSAGQAGIQLQQFIGQIQGGQSAMLALSQQSADLGFVLGAPLVGAIVGIGASVAGLLLPELLKTTDALEQVETLTKNVAAAMTLSSSGVVQYSEKMAQLKDISEGLFQVKLQLLLAEQQMAMKAAASGVDAYIDEFRGLNYQQDLFGKKSDEAFRSFVEISDAANSFKTNQSEENLNRLENALKRATAAGLTNTEAGVKLGNQVTDLIVAYREGEKRITSLNDAVDNGTDSYDFAGNSASSYSDILERLTVRSESLRSEQLKLEKALTLKRATEDGASQATITAIGLTYDKIIANEQEAESQRELNKANAEAARIAREQEKLAKEQDRKLGKFESLATRAITSAEDDPEVQLAMQRDEKLKELRQAYMDADLADTQQFVDASKAIWQSYNNDLESLSQARALNTLASFQSTFDALAGVFKNAQGEQSNAFRAMFAISKGFAVAQAGLNLSKAISDAYAWGGMTIPEKFASAAAIAAAGGQVISAIGSAAYSGREHGGSVMAGVPYEVGEKNKPELLMIPGNNGKVFSNAEVKGMMGGGGGATEVNVYNYGNDQVTTNTSYNQLTRQDVIDIIIGQSNNPNSKMMRNVTRNTTSSNVAGAGKR